MERKRSERKTPSTRHVQERLTCAGTDGTDGPTDSAGAVVDGNTVADNMAK